MKLTQDWVGYLDRSYEQIKRSLLRKLTRNTPELTDHSESNPLIILLSMFAGVGEMLNLYIDSNAREAFLGTARRYTSVVKLTKLIDYKVKARNPASATVQFNLKDGNGNSVTHTNPITIPLGTVITTANSNVPYRLLADTIIPTGQTSAYGTVLQFTDVLAEVLGVSTGAPGFKILISDYYVHGSMKLKVGGEDWALYGSFATMGPQTKAFVIDVEEDGRAYIIFGDGVNGKMPASGAAIVGTYQTTEGSSGNTPPESLDTIDADIPMPPGIILTVTNPDYASGGTDFQDIEEIRDIAPRSVRANYRAVTYQDFIDLAMQVMGVGAAEVSYACGKYVDLYIAPKGKGTATLALVNKVKDYMECKRMITTKVDVKPAGVSRIWIEGKVRGKELRTNTEIQRDLLAALDENFGIATMKINRRVSITDIIAVAEGVSSVDTFEIAKVRVEPFPRPVDLTSNILNVEWTQLPTTTQTAKYVMTYKTATNNFELYKDGIFVQLLALDTVFNDGGAVAFKIKPGTYANNDKWEFTISPSYPEIFPNSVIEIKDYSAAIVDVSPIIDDNTPRTIFSNLTYETTGASSSCLPTA